MVKFENKPKHFEKIPTPGTWETIGKIPASGKKCLAKSPGLPGGGRHMEDLNDALLMGM